MAAVVSVVPEEDGRKWGLVVLEVLLLLLLFVEGRLGIVTNAMCPSNMWYVGTLVTMLVLFLPRFREVGLAEETRRWVVSGLV